MRRLAVIKGAQSLGVPLAEIAAALSGLPADKVPAVEDWGRISEVWQDDLTRRIALLTALRDKMTFCIGCGCLSLKRCPLLNSLDHLAADGPGARLD